MITKSKTDSTHSRRTVFSYLGSKEAVSELFREVAPKVANRPGGYTRIIRTGYRIGDNAEMCLIELVDFNVLYSAEELLRKQPEDLAAKVEKVQQLVQMQQLIQLQMLLKQQKLQKQLKKLRLKRKKTRNSIRTF